MVVDGHDVLVFGRWILVQVVWQEDGWTDLITWSSSRKQLKEYIGREDSVLSREQI